MLSYGFSLRQQTFLSTILLCFKEIAMLNKIILFLLCFGMTVNCLASSPDAWEEFRDEVIASCEKAAPEVLRLDDYSITADPFGSESYGMAIMRGKTPEKADVFHICVYDKGSRKAEVGSEISSEPEHPKVSLIKGPRLDDVRGLNGINGSTRFPIRNHEKYLPDFTASLEQGTREGEAYNYMVFYKDGRVVAEITGDKGKVSAIIVTSRAITPATEGMIGDRLGSFIWGGDEKTYREYCLPGMEEWSGKIICKTRDVVRDDTKHIRHVFSGDYEGPDGELPPLNAAGKFTIEATIWKK